MAKFPACPKCGKRDYIKDLGVAVNTQHHAHNYRCEGCDRWFQVTLGPDAPGKWLMTFWSKPSGQEVDSEFVAVYKTEKGNLYINQRRKFSISGKTTYRSGLSRPMVGLRSTSNSLPRFRTTVRTSLSTVLDADTLDMDVWRMDFNPELLKEVRANASMKDAWLRFPEGYVCAQLEVNSEPRARARRDFLQSLLNAQCAGAQPEQLPAQPKQAGAPGLDFGGFLAKWGNILLPGILFLVMALLLLLIN